MGETDQIRTGAELRRLPLGSVVKDSFGQLAFHHSNNFYVYLGGSEYSTGKMAAGFGPFQVAYQPRRGSCTYTIST